jgi:hypothetical protein
MLNTGQATYTMQKPLSSTDGGQQYTITLPLPCHRVHNACCYIASTWIMSDNLKPFPVKCLSNSSSLLIEWLSIACSWLISHCNTRLRLEPPNTTDSKFSSCTTFLGLSSSRGTSDHGGLGLSWISSVCKCGCFGGGQGGLSAQWSIHNWTTTRNYSLAEN